MNLLTLIAASWMGTAEVPQPVLLASAPIQLAQAGGPPPRDAGRRPPPRKDPAQLAEEIGLDAAQSTQFVTILSEQRGKHEALREQMRDEREAARQAHQRIDEETFLRLSQVLTTEQLARFHAQRPPPPPPHRERGRGPGKGRHGDRS